MEKTFPSIKTGWWSFALPEYRPHPKPRTYSLFSYEDLPPLQKQLDDDFQWLKPLAVKKHSLAEGCYSDGSKPDLGKLSEIMAQVDLKLPQSFLTFIASPELHERIRSCTDCYLDVADRAVKTKGANNGFLIHFLADSQWCGHWYLYIDHSGNHFVVTSLNAYGFTFDDTDADIYQAHVGISIPESQTGQQNQEFLYAVSRNTADCQEEVELEQEEIWFCAPSFSEFIHRFWLENEIWFALAWDKRRLTSIEQAYVNHYHNLTQ